MGSGIIEYHLVVYPPIWIQIHWLILVPIYSYLTMCHRYVISSQTNYTAITPTTRHRGLNRDNIKNGVPIGTMSDLKASTQPNCFVNMRGKSGQRTNLHRAKKCNSGTGRGPRKKTSHTLR